MGDINDLLPKEKTITVQGVELTVKPMRLRHALHLSKIADVFTNHEKYKAADIDEADKLIHEIVGELIPQLAGKELSFDLVGKLVGEMLNTVAPSDTRELDERGVKLDTDPKARGNG